MTNITRVMMAVDSRQVRQGTQELNRMQSAGVRSESAVASLGRRLLALGAGVMVVRSIANQFRAVVHEGELLQRNMMRTEQLVRSTGQAAGFSAQQLHEQARELARATLRSTEEVMQAQQILLTFRQVAGETFERTTELAADLATVTGTNLTSAMTQLGKVLEDPIRNLGQLNRSGVSFTQSQTDMIKEFWEAGRAVEAQTLILDVLAGQYEGVARNEAKGLAGAQDTLAQAVQEARQAVSESLRILDRFAEAAFGAASSVESMTEQFERGEGPLNTFVNAIKHTAAVVYITKKEITDLANWVGYLLAVMDLKVGPGFMDRLRAINEMRAEFREATEQDIVDFIAGLWNIDEALKAVDESAGAATDTTKKLASISVAFPISEFEALVRKIDPVNAALDDFADMVWLLDDALRLGIITMDEYARLLALLDATLDDASDSMGRATESVGRMTEEADPFQVAWERAIQRIDDLFVDLWASAFQGFRSFVDAIQNTFRRMLAEMAHAAITKPIVVRMGAAIGGMGAGTAAAGDGMSGMGGLAGITGVGTNMGFGAAGLGGAALGSLFGGQGAAGGAAGGMAGYYLTAGLGSVIPVVGAIGGALLGGLLGGQFGGAPSNKAAMADIDLGTGDILGLDQMTGKKAPGQETLDARDVMAALIGQSVLGIGALGGTTSGQMRIDIGERDGIQIDTGDGLMHIGNSLDEAMENVIDILLDSSEGLDGAFHVLIKAVEGGENRLAMLGALGDIRQLQGFDAMGAGRDQFAREQMTARDIYNEQTDALRDLIREYDGSLEATLELRDAYAMQQEAMANLGYVLALVQSELTGIFDSLAEQIRQDLMDEEELYEHRQQRVHDLIDAVAEMDDPTHILAAMREIEQLTGDLWSSLDQTQKDALGQGFLDFLEQAERAGLDRLEELGVELEALDIHLADSVDKSLHAAAMNIDSAEMFRQSATSQLDAAASQIESAQLNAQAAQQFGDAVAQFMQAVNTPLRVQGGGGEVHTR